MNLENLDYTAVAGPFSLREEEIGFSVLGGKGEVIAWAAGEDSALMAWSLLRQLNKPEVLARDIPRYNFLNGEWVRQK